MRERGLKHEVGLMIDISSVAPHAGAWIETHMMRHLIISFRCRSPCGSVD